VEEMIHFNIYQFVGVCRLFQQQLFLFWKQMKMKSEKTKDRLEEHAKELFPQLITRRVCSIEFHLKASATASNNEDKRLMRTLEHISMI
jgi:hypothetical protein